MTAPSVAEAYRACETITRDQARNFHYGIRLLPAPKRSALCAVYALARRIDDVGDAPDVPGPEKLAALEVVRREVDALAAGVVSGDDPVLLAVADAARRYPVPLGAFGELVDGVAADVAVDARAVVAGAAPAYATFDELVGYCRAVAGSVGRLCLGIFGDHTDADQGASHLADTLGIALQQTNILRDIREDLLGGRVYLPTEELDAHGVALSLDAAGHLHDPHGGLAAEIREAADRARGWYAEGMRLMPLLDRRSAACTGAMAGIYRRLLEEIAADPTSVYTGRRALSGRQKAWVAVRALTGGAR